VNPIRTILPLALFLGASTLTGLAQTANLAKFQSVCFDMAAIAPSGVTVNTGSNSRSASKEVTPESLTRDFASRLQQGGIPVNCASTSKPLFMLVTAAPASKKLTNAQEYKKTVPALNAPAAKPSGPSGSELAYGTDSVVVVLGMPISELKEYANTSRTQSAALAPDAAWDYQLAKVTEVQATSVSQWNAKLDAASQQFIKDWNASH
jgi:hypothetical protein